MLLSENHTSQFYSKLTNLFKIPRIKTIDFSKIQYSNIFPIPNFLATKQSDPQPEKTLESQKTKNPKNVYRNINIQSDKINQKQT